MDMPELRSPRKPPAPAGAIVARYFREGIAMRSKDVANLVSDADIEAERASST